MAAGVTTGGVTWDSVWVGDVVVEPVPVWPSAAPASAACAVASCGVDEPVGLEPAVGALELVTAGGIEVAGTVDVVDAGAGRVETAVTGFVVVDNAVAVAVAGLCPPGLEPAEAVVPVPTETPPGACARAPRLVGGASSFMTIFVWIASTTPEALRL